MDQQGMASYPDFREDEAENVERLAPIDLAQRACAYGDRRYFHQRGTDFLVRGSTRSPLGLQDAGHKSYYVCPHVPQTGPAFAKATARQDVCATLLRQGFICKEARELIGALALRLIDTSSRLSTIRLVQY